LRLGEGVANPGWNGRGASPLSESSYVPAADIVSFDVYPYNACGSSNPSESAICGEFWMNALGIENLLVWENAQQSAWTWIETTGSVTPAQTASEVWLALIHGAGGIGYYVDVFTPTFREDGVFNNPAMVTALTSLNSQITGLAPLLNSKSINGYAGVKSSNAAVPVDYMVKGTGTTMYIFAATSQDGTTNATFKIALSTENATVTVLNEARTIPMTKGSFSDSFAQNGYHIYKVDLSSGNCN